MSVSSSNKLAIFRCDAASSIGGGHVMRCMALANELQQQGWQCKFVTSQDSYDFINKLEKFDRVDPKEFWDTPFAHDLLVVDHYELDVEYEEHFREFAAKILVIDDLANRNHTCDYLLDQTYGRAAKDYTELVPEKCKIFTGSNYALLRPEFAELRQQAIARRKQTKEINSILVNFGASDPDKYTLIALQHLKNIGFVGKIDVVLGFAQSYLYEVKQYAQSMQNKVIIHQDANMAQLMYEADLAIGAAGSTTWERCCLGLPSFVSQTADNQSTVFENLLRDGILLDLCDIEKYLLSWPGNIDYSKIFTVCDGNGVRILAEEFI